MHYYTLLKGFSGAQAGNMFDLERSVRDHSLAVLITDPDGGLSALKIALDWSPDEGTTWIPIVTYTVTAAGITAGNEGWHINNRVMRFIRARITQATGATANTSITVIYEKGER